jgi:putative acetyltransferase
MDITLERLTAATTEVLQLLEELDQALTGPYSEEQSHALPVDRLFQPHIRFFLARMNGEAVACGGIAFFDGYAELKRMYAKPKARGRGAAKSLLDRLEAEAREAGTNLVRIETGAYQQEAIKFYERAGYRRCGPFGPYAQMSPKAIELSLFFEKSLTAC